MYERQNKANEMRYRLETELAKAHIEAKFAWDKGATEDQMKDVLKLIRQHNGVGIRRGFSWWCVHAPTNEYQR